MLRYFTSGESHGEALVAFLSGLPAGLKVDQDFLDRELWRRQQGYGRGGRMKIETDKAHILSGVHHGITIASPISVLLENKDWKNWQESLPVAGGDPEKHKSVKSPRPGHADLAGALKYNFPEARYVLERASARESAARVADWCACQVVSARTWHRGSQPRGKRWIGKFGIPSDLATDSIRLPEDRNPAGMRRSRD